jgi:hypothetical protein
MKKLLLFALVGLFTLAGCGQDNPAPAETPTHIPAGTSVDLSTTTAFLSVTQACGTNVVWTYSGISTPGYVAVVDGQVTSAGVFSAPVCGSNLLGTTVTVTATCDGKPPATANIIVGQELVTLVTIVAADVKLCGGAVCRSSTPTNVTIPACPAATPTTIQYYARIDTSCGTGAVFVPSNPAAVSPLPPACTF